MPNPISKLRGGPDVIRVASDPGWGSYLVDPDNDDDLPVPARSLYVTGAGDVSFIGADGETDTWTVPDNFLLPVAVSRVLATGTDATGIHAIV